eukprot:364814-Chlamydomonas_euryale.AAC.8
MQPSRQGGCPWQCMIGMRVGVGVLLVLPSAPMIYHISAGASVSHIHQRPCSYVSVPVPVPAMSISAHDLPYQCRCQCQPYPSAPMIADTSPAKSISAHVLTYQCRCQCQPYPSAPMIYHISAGASASHIHWQVPPMVLNLRPVAPPWVGLYGMTCRARPGTLGYDLRGMAGDTWV